AGAHRTRPRRRSAGTAPGGFRLLLSLGLTTVSDPGPGDEEASEPDDDDENTSAPATRVRSTFRNFFTFSPHAGPPVLPAVAASRQHTAESDADAHRRGAAL